MLQERLVYRLLTQVSDLIVQHQQESTPVALQSSFDRAVFSLCGPRAILSAALRILSTRESSLSLPCLQQTLRCLRKLLLSSEQQPTTDSSSSSSSLWISSSFELGSSQAFDIQQWVEVLLVVPAKIANACWKCRVQLPAWAVRAAFFEKLVQNAILLVLVGYGDDEEEEHKSTNNNDKHAYLQTLLFKLVLHGHADPAAAGIQSCYNEIDEPKKKERLSQVLHASLRSFPSTRYAAVLLQSIVVAAVAQRSMMNSKDDNKHYYLQTTCLATLQSSKEVRECWVHLMVLSRQRSSKNASRAVCQAVAMLLAECNKNQTLAAEESTDDDDGTSSSSNDDDEHQNDPSILYKSLCLVASSWSNPLFVQQTDQSLQRHVTTFLLCGLELLPHNATTSASSAKLTMTLLKGVTERLQSSNQSLRLDGMRIGECVAERLGEPLTFEELEAERKEGKVEQQEETNSQTRRKPSLKNVDSEDAVHVSDDSSQKSHIAADNDSDSVWSDELIPYDLSDDEQDLQAVPTPLYLRQCLDMLRAPESEETAIESQDMALKTIPRLVRSRPADLVDLAVPLAKHLIFAENTFDKPDFQDDVSEGLLALTVTNPISVGEYLISMFFDNISLGKRLVTLSVLEQAVHELSGEKALREARSERAAVMASASADKRVSGKRQLVSDSSQLGSATYDSLQARTRRWGRARQNRHAALKVVNEFSSVAPVWFYLLLRGFMKSRDNTTLWSGHIGAKALTNFQLLLATIVQYSGNLPGIAILANDLIELAWSFRNVTDAEIRSAVLVALGNSLAVLSNDALISALYANSGSLLEYLRQTTLNDSDETCRYLAGTLSKTIVESVDGERLVAIEER